MGPRDGLQERIVEVSSELFTDQGIKGVTMDRIASSVGISKRTLYEVFVDKEALLEACIWKSQEKDREFIRTVMSSSDNVLEVLMKCYQYNIQRFYSTNKLFFEEIKKYPKAYARLLKGHDRDSEEVISFFNQGVKQGIFRSDVNFAIMNLLLKEQLNMLMNTDICERFSFIEVYESIMFTYLRGISTEKGARELEKFICEYRRTPQG